MTWLRPRPLISPFTTTIAPMGTSPASLAAAASANASRMNSSSDDPMLRIRFRRQRRILAAARAACQETRLQSYGLECRINQRTARLRTGSQAMMLKTRNGPLYFEIVGSGPPLVFLSGWAMSSECWRPVVTLLAKKYRCLLYDARGVGRSQPAALDAQLNIEDHADDLHRVLEPAGV